MQESLDMAEVILEAEQLGLLIAESVLAEEYRNSKQALLQDREAQSIIREFQHKKEIYEEVQRIGKFHPDYEKARREIYEVKRRMDRHPAVARFKKAEEDLEELLHEISLTLAASVSPDIKVPGANPYFVGGGCGGCGTGGTCGCRS